MSPQSHTNWKNTNMCPDSLTQPGKTTNTCPHSPTQPRKMKKNMCPHSPTQPGKIQTCVHTVSHNLEKYKHVSPQSHTT